MIDLCLKFPSEAEATLALFDGETPKYAAIDVIGAIEGAEGWHVNVRHGVEMPELAAWVVMPATPARVWF